MAEELVTESHWQMKEKESRRIIVVEAFSLIEKRIQELNNQLTEADRERKSVEAALHGAKRQVEINANNSARLRITYLQLRSRLGP